MDNDYKSYYLKDLIPLIDRVAFETMIPPHVMTGANTSGMWTENNACVAIFNEGVRNMVIRLREVLLKEEEDNG